jgi:hypothetical protein
LGAAAAVSTRGLWAVLATGPVAGTVTLLVNAALSDLACGPGIRPWLIAIALAMLALDVGAGVVAWRSARVAPPLAEDAHHDWYQPFLTHAALLSCALFAVAIASMAVPPALLHDCR